MPKIVFQPGGTIVEAATGSELLAAAKSAGLSVEAPCGGRGVCGRCLVRVLSGEASFTPNGVLPDELVAEGYILICIAKVGTTDLVLEVTSNLEEEQGKFAEAAEDRLLVDRHLLPAQEDLDPLVRRVSLRVAPPALGDGLSDLDRLQRALKAALENAPADSGPLDFPLPLLRLFPDAVRADHGRVTVGCHVEPTTGAVSIVSLEVGDTRDKDVGLAVDIGTTTVAVQFVDLSNGHVLASGTDYNAQIECGLDVISRINYARRPARLEELRAKVLSTINALIGTLSAKIRIDSASVLTASVSGNPTMTHLLLGIPPEHIRLEPYVPAVFDVPLYTASDVCLALHPGALVQIAPSVGSYVGGDITSGLLCTRLAEEEGEKETVLFLDIGTNGELVLGGDGFLLACACSAGPAFEGGGIEHGMRASRGAIENVSVDPETGLPTWATIGNVPPVGICGSGMISLVANLFATGWLDAGGRLDRSRPCAAIELRGKTARYHLATAEQAGKGAALYVSEADIDNLVRAKAAIFSACRTMLHKIGLDFSDLTRMYIAGGFGRYLDIEYAKTIGLLPDLPVERFSFIGNSSMLGSYLTLLSRRHRDRRLALAHSITYLDLSVEIEYMDHYTAALFLPHTDKSLFPSVPVYNAKATAEHDRGIGGT